jgi:hypothetical protein
MLHQQALLGLRGKLRWDGDLEASEVAPAAQTFTVLEVAEELKQAYSFDRDEANER